MVDVADVRLPRQAAESTAFCASGERVFRLLDVQETVLTGKELKATVVEGADVTAGPAMRVSSSGETGSLLLLTCFLFTVRALAALFFFEPGMMWQKM